MHPKLKIYLDTSVPNFIFADDAPEKKSITIDFFENFIKTEKYHTYISEFVIAEIEDTRSEEKRKKLFDTLSHYPIDVLQITKKIEVNELAQKYIDGGVIPKNKVMDALHIAVCMVYGISVLVSWNYRHLANINKENKVKIVNYQNNYFNDIRIITPFELVDYDN
jgi:predicted nucleic acid-binding protein